MEARPSVQAAIAREESFASRDRSSVAGENVPLRRIPSAAAPARHADQPHQ
jgi:hypothetical protein